MPQNSKKSKVLKITRIALICVFAIIFVVSAYMVTNAVLDYGKAKNLYEDIYDQLKDIENQFTGADETKNVFTVRPVDDTTSSGQVDTGIETTPVTGPAETTTGGTVDTTAPAPDTTAPVETPPSEKFLKICEMIKGLQATNPEVVGYIKIQFEENEYISYPICRNDDNLYYTTHAYNKTDLKSGAIFLDSRCDPVISKNTASLIFGHNMNDGSMFAKLTKFKTAEYFNNVNVTIYTLEGIYTYKVFSVHNANADDDYTNIYFKTDAEYLAFLQKMQNASYIKSNLKLYTTDQIITLSTCLNTTVDARLAVHAVLISIER
jgi:sortase B